MKKSIVFPMLCLISCTTLATPVALDTAENGVTSEATQTELESNLELMPLLPPTDNDLSSPTFEIDEAELAKQAAEEAIRRATDNLPAAESTRFADSRWTLAALSEYFKEWASVRYRYGGMSKRGIDCSGFVYVTVYHQLGIRLPRNTRSLLRLGEHIAQSDLQTGDLVFFKTGRSLRHVGIYLEKGLFMHASTHEGVTMSSLDETYWANTYWTARRLDFSKFG